MLRAIGRFLLYVLGFEQPIRLVKQPPGESWEAAVRQLAEDQRVEAEVRTSGYIAPASVGETMTEAWRIAVDEDRDVLVQWRNGLPVISRIGHGGSVMVDPATFPNAVKSGRMSVPSSCLPKNIPKKVAAMPDHLFGDKGRVAGPPITLDMLTQASLECSDLLTYPVFEDPATMKRAAEPETVRKLYSLYRG